MPASARNFEVLGYLLPALVEWKTAGCPERGDAERRLATAFDRAVGAYNELYAVGLAPDALPHDLMGTDVAVVRQRIALEAVQSERAAYEVRVQEQIPAMKALGLTRADAVHRMVAGILAEFEARPELSDAVSADLRLLVLWHGNPTGTGVERSLGPGKVEAILGKCRDLGIPIGLGDWYLNAEQLAALELIERSAAIDLSVAQPSAPGSTGGSTVLGAPTAVPVASSSVRTLRPAAASNDELPTYAGTVYDALAKLAAVSRTVDPRLLVGREREAVEAFAPALGAWESAGLPDDHQLGALEVASDVVIAVLRRLVTQGALREDQLVNAHLSVEDRVQSRALDRSARACGRPQRPPVVRPPESISAVATHSDGDQPPGTVQPLSAGPVAAPSPVAPASADPARPVEPENSASPAPPARPVPLSIPSREADDPAAVVGDPAPPPNPGIGAVAPSPVPFLAPDVHTLTMTTSREQAAVGDSGEEACSAVPSPSVAQVLPVVPRPVGLAQIALGASRNTPRLGDAGPCLSPETLAQYAEHARDLLLQCTDMRDAQIFARRAEVIANYVRSVRAGLEAQSAAEEVVLRARRRLGELTRDLPKAPAGRKSNGSHAATYSGKGTALTELGITKQEANRLEKLASIPQAPFDEYVATAKASGRPPTTRGALTLAAAATRPLTKARETCKAGAPSPAAADPVSTGGVKKEANAHEGPDGKDDTALDHIAELEAVARKVRDPLHLDDLHGSALRREWREVAKILTAIIDGTLRRKIERIYSSLPRVGDAAEEHRGSGVDVTDASSETTHTPAKATGTKQVSVTSKPEKRPSVKAMKTAGKSPGANHG